jgi:hypothetical protein
LNEYEIRKPLDVDHFCNSIARSLRDRYRMTDMTGNDVKSELHISSRTLRTEKNVVMTIRKRDEASITVGNIMKSLSTASVVEKPILVEQKETLEEEIPVKKTVRKKIIPKLN